VSKASWVSNPISCLKVETRAKNGADYGRLSCKVCFLLYSRRKNLRELSERISAGRPKSWSWSLPLLYKESEYRSHHEHSLLSPNDLKCCRIQSPAFRTVWSVLCEFRYAKALYRPVWIEDMVAQSAREGDGWLGLRWFFIARCPVEGCF